MILWKIHDFTQFLKRFMIETNVWPATSIIHSSISPVQSNCIAFLLLAASRVLVIWCWFIVLHPRTMTNCVRAELVCHSVWCINFVHFHSALLENRFVLLQYWSGIERNHQFSLSFSQLIFSFLAFVVALCRTLFLPKNFHHIDLSLLAIMSKHIHSIACDLVRFSWYCFSQRFDGNTCILSTWRFMSILSSRHIK